MKTLTIALALALISGCGSSQNWKVGDRGVLNVSESRINIPEINQYGVPVFSSYLAFSEFCKSVRAGDGDGAQGVLGYARFVVAGTQFLVLEVQPNDGYQVKFVSGEAAGLAGYVHINFLKKQ